MYISGGSSLCLGSMKSLLTCVICLVSLIGYSQRDYDSLLSARLQSIRTLRLFENTVVLFEDTVDAGMDFPYWTADSLFYQDDVVKYKHRSHYRALTDNKGKQPDISPKYWTLYGQMSPYFFLRDTARTEDLVRLLKADHPYIRIFAFSALVWRKHNGLFQILVDNMADTTQINYFTGDVGEVGYPADLMISYIIHDLGVQQKDSLKKLIVTKHSHLNTLQDVLRFHIPSDEQYPYVRAIAIREPSAATFVALSKYRRDEDVQLISQGFGLNPDAWYYDYYYLAIENFPHKSFEKKLIDAGNEKKSGALLVYSEYYMRALAKYKTKACLRVLEKYAHQYMLSHNNGTKPSEKKANLSRIYRALKRNYTPMYNKLINEIITETEGKIEDRDEDVLHTNNPWDY
jgi:hypothetical protein